MNREQKYYTVNRSRLPKPTTSQNSNIYKIGRLPPVDTSYNFEIHRNDNCQRSLLNSPGKVKNFFNDNRNRPLGIDNPTIGQLFNKQVIVPSIGKKQLNQSDNIIKVVPVKYSHNENLNQFPSDSKHDLRSVFVEPTSTGQYTINSHRNKYNSIPQLQNSQENNEIRINCQQHLYRHPETSNFQTQYPHIMVESENQHFYSPKVKHVMVDTQKNYPQTNQILVESQNDNSYIQKTRHIQVETKNSSHRPKTFDNCRNSTQRPITRQILLESQNHPGYPSHQQIILESQLQRPQTRQIILEPQNPQTHIRIDTQNTLHKPGSRLIKVENQNQTQHYIPNSSKVKVELQNNKSAKQFKVKSQHQCNRQYTREVEVKASLTRPHTQEIQVKTEMQQNPPTFEINYKSQPVNKSRTRQITVEMENQNQHFSEGREYNLESNKRNFPVEPNLENKEQLLVQEIGRPHCKSASVSISNVDRNPPRKRSVSFATDKSCQINFSEFNQRPKTSSLPVFVTENQKRDRIIENCTPHFSHDRKNSNHINISFELPPHLFNKSILPESPPLIPSDQSRMPRIDDNHFTQNPPVIQLVLPSENMQKNKKENIFVLNKVSSESSCSSEENRKVVEMIELNLKKAEKERKSKKKKKLKKTKKMAKAYLNKRLLNRGYSMDSTSSNTTASTDFFSMSNGAFFNNSSTEDEFEYFYKNKRYRSCNCKKKKKVNDSIIIVKNDNGNKENIVYLEKDDMMPKQKFEIKQDNNNYNDYAVATQKPPLESINKTLGEYSFSFNNGINDQKNKEKSSILKSVNRNRSESNQPVTHTVFDVQEVQNNFQRCIPESTKKISKFDSTTSSSSTSSSSTSSASSSNSVKKKKKKSKKFGFFNCKHCKKLFDSKVLSLHKKNCTGLGKKKN